MKLHDYWRSTASYRVRIALNLKGLAYDRAPHDLRRAEQREEAYLALNPQGLVPALETGSWVLTQSLAILEWLEETYPEPPLLPPDPDDRAIVRAMAAIVACDIHPLNNLRVLDTLRGPLRASEDQVLAWISRWIGDGFAALEPLVARHGGRFAFGDTPTYADCCLVPQLYSAERFGVDVSAFPRLRGVSAAARDLPEVSAAQPNLQPGAAPL